jgi:dihydrodipicolinate synthase/N-acetylneuraminate lyase
LPENAVAAGIGRGGRGPAGVSGIGGIYPMLYAFFDSAGHLDRAAMRRQVEGCLAAGAHGIALLGLATEVGKLTLAEKHQLMAWAAEDLAERLPLAVTVTGASVADQLAFARAAADAGASWVVLQPPTGTSPAEADLVRFFGAVADGAPLPVAIQNAPGYIGIGLSDAALATLARQHPNLQLLKWEGPAAFVERTIAATEGRLRVFNGRGGLELPDNLRAGCAGLIPTPETIDVQARIFDLMAAGDPQSERSAEELYASILPLIVYLMQSIDTLLCYGKRLAARRLDLGTVHDRVPALVPSEFGLRCLERYSRSLTNLA